MDSIDNKQTPLHSGFDATTTATEALAGRDLSGIQAIVTGGASGLGLETVRVLAGAGARVLVPARDPHQAQATLDGMAGVEVAALDLLDPQSIDAFAAAFLATGRALHVLVNGAGIMATPLLRDARGYEAQFATNHLGHFQLTARLWPALRRAQGRAWCACRRWDTGRQASTWTTRISCISRTTSGAHMRSRKAPMPCLPWSWTGAPQRTACAPSRCIRAPS